MTPLAPHIVRDLRARAARGLPLDVPLPELLDALADAQREVAALRGFVACVADEPRLPGHLRRAAALWMPPPPPQEVRS